MPNATILQFPGAPEQADDDVGLYTFVLHDFGRALKEGKAPADAAAIAVAEALRGTLAWPDEERLKYAESLEREAGMGR